jgi:hypothetical protein
MSLMPQKVASFVAAILCRWPLAPAVLLAGCGAKDEIPGRLPTYAITGEVFVDGQPAVDAFVYLNPAGADRPRLRPYAQVDNTGKFAVSTYETRDGAPAGEYVVTIEWLTYQPLGNQWSGPDKLGGRYAKPSESNLRLTVEEQQREPVRYELSGK